MSNKKKQKETVIERPKEYKCNICGQEHEVNSMCPIILEKLNKMEKQKKKNFWWGNIFLECLEQDKDLYDLLYEISYINEMYTSRGMDFSNINMELALDYCAMELNCSPKKFLMHPEKTIEKLMSLIGYLSYEGTCRNDNGQIEEISFGVEMTLPDRVYGSLWTMNPRLYAAKERMFDGSWCYRLYFDCSYMFINGKDGQSHGYFICDGNGRSGYALLAEDYTGPLAKEIEDMIDTYWVEISETVSSDDLRFDAWINKLKEATLENKLCWRNINDFYTTEYEGCIIRVDLNQEYKPLMYFENNESDYIYHQLSIRFDRERAITFTLKDEEDKIEKLFSLIPIIKESIERMETLVQTPNLEEKKIEFTDVLVVSSSMHCKTKGHKVIPYRGIVNILTKDNKEEEYYIYVGHCRECKTYTVFELDYRKMLEKGKPLCMVYKYDDILEGKVHSEFRYKSQSVLAIKGYNVQAGSELLENERQIILKDSLDSKIIETHDLLDFLNWLVRTREPLPKYKNAIAKWKKDIAFVEEYKKEERDSVFVKSITIK